MPRRRGLVFSLGGALALFVILAVLGLWGAATVYAQALGQVAGAVSGVFGTSVRFDGELIVVVQDTASLLQRPLELHPNFSYSAILLLVGLVAATPGQRWQKRIVLGSATALGVLAGQAFLLAGFSLIDTSTAALFSQSKSIYTAWWSMGPLLFAAWWFWTRWLPSLVQRDYQGDARQ